MRIKPRTSGPSSARSGIGRSRCLLSFGQYPLHHPEAFDADGRRADTRGLILRPKLTTESAAYRVHWRSTRRQRSRPGQLSSRLRDAAVTHIHMRTGDHVRDLVLEPTAAVAPDDPNYSRRLWHGLPLNMRLTRSDALASQWAETPVTSLDLALVGCTASLGGRRTEGIKSAKWCHD